jgi:lipooligosaccharide transport system ATP-binding protein
MHGQDVDWEEAREQDIFRCNNFYRGNSGEAMPPMVMAEGLVKRYGDLVAVNGVDFTVRKGELFGFLGPNGAGKTTTMKMIQCVVPKTAGRLEVAGMRVEGNERSIKRILGVAPQENNLDPDFSPYDNLMVYARYFDIPKEEAKARARELLEFMQLWERRNDNINKLSGGMKKRLILARALINNPKILILDEPTVGLDPQARHLIWDKLRQLSSKGITILLTTHYMEEAAQLCDQLVIMNFGKIIARGPPKDIIRRRAGSSVVEVPNEPGVIGCLKRLKREHYDIFGDTVYIYTERPTKVVSTLIDVCGVRRVAAREATLEDVFLKLTGRELRE